VPSFLLLDPTSPAAIPLSMLILFAAAKGMAELLERLGQPGIVGEIIAGVLIGPSVFNWLQPNDFLNALSDLGAMFLLFRVGLEVKSSELLKVGGTAAMVAAGGVVVPFLMGWGILLLWGGSQHEAIFVGASMVATSVGITAQVLSAKGLLHALSSKIVLAAAVIDDVLGLLVLAVVSSATRGHLHWLELAITALLAIGFTFVVARWGTRTMQAITPLVETSLRVAESQFVVAMLLLFGLAVLAVYSGVAAIVGAFLAGMALADSTGRRVHDLAQGVGELLVPFFLAGIGLKVSLSVFAQPSTALLAIVILIAAMASKFIGCGLGAIRLGRRDAVRIGVGMIPRGEVGMVVAQLGLTIGAIQQSVFGVVVFMSLLTTIVTPMLLKLAYKGERHAPAEATFRLP
jgi:Kef-type K+ transport system membrane component KefB